MNEGVVIKWVFCESTHPNGILLADGFTKWMGPCFGCYTRGSVGNSFRIGSFHLGCY